MEQSKYWDLIMEKLYGKINFVPWFLWSSNKFWRNKKIIPEKIQKRKIKLKNQNQPYEIQWNTKSFSKEQQTGKETCKLCLTEALIILEQNKNCINKRN